MGINRDRELVRLCVKELCGKMNYTDPSRLAQSDLEHLSYLIGEKTKIIISHSTLKRIFNEKFERLPQASTLDALTIFTGYSGWLDFKTKKTTGASAILTEPVSVAEQSQNSSSGSWLALRKYRYIVLSVTAGILLFIAFRKIISEDVPEVQFSIKKIVSDELPKSVVFNYNIDHVDGDSFFIQPNWNEAIRIHIKKKNYTQTETYYEPGYHMAKLICDGRVLGKVAVHIPTKGWVGYSKVNFRDPYPEYFSSELIIRDSVLGIDLAGLNASNIKTDASKIYYYACFPDSIRATSDNFSMKARVRMKKIKNTLCPWIISEVYSENSFFYFTGTIPGCTSESQARFADTYVDGNTIDLSSFGFDVFNWTDVEIRGVNKTIIIFIGGQKAFEKTYTRPAGLIKGMGFGSNGLCEVDYVELKDSIGNVSYFRDF